MKDLFSSVSIVTRIRPQGKTVWRDTSVPSIQMKIQSKVENPGFAQKKAAHTQTLMAS